MNAPLRLEVLRDHASLLARFPLLKQLNPTLTEERYSSLLRAILAQGNYFQLACFEGEKCLGVTGVWIGTQIWCGRYIEVDNFVVDESARGKGVGQRLLEWVEIYGREQNCESVHLDSYIVNERANHFYTQRGFRPLGYHMTKKL